MKFVSSVCAVAGLVGLAMSATIPSAFAAGQNNGLPNRDQTVVLMMTMADKGLACDHLLPWESLALKVQVLQAEGDRMTMQQKQDAADKVAARMAEIECDDEALTGYLELARPGIEREILPPFLVIYHTLASMDAPPTSFVAAAPRLDYRNALARIEDMFLRLEDKGYKPEGGGTWEDYRKKLSGIMTEALEAMENGEPIQSRKMKQALTFIPTSAIIVEQWLADTEMPMEAE